MFSQLEKIIILLKSWIKHKKWGSVTVNFANGQVGVVEIKEKLKLEK